jgi:hypothetical protein
MSGLLSRRAWIGAFSRGINVKTDFAGGSIGKIEIVNNAYLRARVAGQSDQDGRNRQANWYYFEVHGASQDRDFRIDLIDLPGEYNYQPNRGAVTKDTRPHVWMNGQWGPCDGDFDDSEPKWTLRIPGSRIPRNGQPFRIAHIVPYVERDLRALQSEVRPKVKRIGKTVQGRPIDLWTFNGNLPMDSPTVWLMFRQHAWESGSSWTADGMLRHLPKGVIWKVLPCCDPDGMALGGVRFNRHGFDLNRNWDSPDDFRLRPEICYQKAAIENWLRQKGRCDLFLSLHNTETSEYLEGPPGGVGQKLFGLLQSGTRFRPTREYFTRMDWQGQGRANVIQYLWTRHKVPACLMELKVAGVDYRDWKVFGQELATSIAAALR